MRRSTRLSIFCLPLLTAMLYADQVTLGNGDRLTGQIVKSDGKTLTLKTESVGTVDIKWDAIASLNSDKTVYVETTPNKKTYTGNVSTKDDSLVVTTEKNQTLTVPKSEVAALRSPDEQRAHEMAEHPGFMQGWAGGANVSFALTGGNSQTENLALGFTAARTGLRDKLSLYTNSVYSRNNASGAVPSVTANTVQGGIRYDHDITDRVFGFGSADFMADQLQGLNLRSVLGGGLGYHVIKREATTFDLLAGINYTRENYTAFSRNFPGATLGEEFMHKFAKAGSTVLNEKFYFFPDLSSSGEYRTEFDFGTVTKLNKWFGWQNTFSDIYVTNPPAGKKKNDILFATGLNLAFTH